MATVYDNASLIYGTDTNIRLIELLPETTWCDGERFQINCKFHVLPLASRPEYTAISYMWGEATDTADILLDGKKFAVRINLFQMLETFSGSVPGMLWVDAICIDQASIQERNHQVRLMGSIYSQATRVLVWLGSHHEDILQALKNIDHFQKKNIGPFAFMTTRPPDLDRAIRRLQLNPRRANADNLPAISILHQLAALCNHPYWSRVWIVQELILAKRIQIQCGKIRVPMKSLNIELQTIRSRLKELGARPLPTVVTEIMTSMAAKLIQKRDWWKRAKGQSYIEPWDTGFGKLGCSDVRDRVYAMLALMDPNRNVTPDYSKTPSDLLKDIFEQRLERTGVLVGSIWNLQAMLELDDHDPVVLWAQQFGSLEWSPSGTLGLATDRPPGVPARQVQSFATSFATSSMQAADSHPPPPYAERES